jgi:CDP-4-dehydro-6-deoxyglucose reductase
MEGYMRIVSAQVRLQPSGHEFFVEGADTILEAALRSGLALNYGCSSGNCGLCKARVVSGETQRVCHHDYSFSEAEKGMGYILTCSHTAVTDIVIEALEASRPGDIPLQVIEAKVKAIEPLGDALMRLHIQTPRSNRLRFLAGQSVSLDLGDSTHEFPIASCPCDDRNLEFHIPAEDAFLQGLKKGDEIHVRGPYGEFVLRENTGREPLFIACGAGFAPVKSLIEHAMALDMFASIRLYRVSSTYLSNLCRSWEDALDNFSHVAVDGDSFLHEDLADLADRDVYVAGPADFVETTRLRLLSIGLPEAQLSVFATPSNA